MVGSPSRSGRETRGEERAVARQPLLNAAGKGRGGEGLDQCMYDGCMCFPKIYALSHANLDRDT